MKSFAEVIPADCPERMTAGMLARIIGVSIQTIHRFAETGVLPQPMRLGPKVIRWDREEVRQVLKNAQLLTGQPARQDSQQTAQQPDELPGDIPAPTDSGSPTE